MFVTICTRRVSWRVRGRRKSAHEYSLYVHPANKSKLLCYPRAWATWVDYSNRICRRHAAQDQSLPGVYERVDARLPASSHAYVPAVYSGPTNQDACSHGRTLLGTRCV
eukprot:6187621-Pleurochrysis_carterae.AAC.2